MPFTYNDEPVGFSEVGHKPGLTVTRDVDSELASASVATTPPADFNPAISDVPRVTDESLTPGPDVQTPYDAVEAPKFADVPTVDGGVVTTQPPAERPSVLAAAFRQENLVVGAIEALSRDRSFPVEPDHNPWETIRGTDLEGNWQEFLASQSQAETDQIAERIRAERRDRQTLSKAGWGGTGAAMLATVFDPTILIPIGGAAYKAVRGGQAIAAGKTALQYGAGAGAAVAAQEAGLQALQYERPLEQSAAAIGGSILLGALLGAGASGLASRQFAKLGDRLDDIMRVPENSADDAFGDGGLATVRAAGAQAAENKTPLELESAFGIEKAASFQDPLLRTLTSPLIAVRETAARLSETVLGATRNAKGETTAPVGGSVETRIKTQGTARLGQAVTELDKAFSDYRFGKGNAKFAAGRAAIQNMTGQSTKLTYKQFKDEVGRAMARFDEHEIPEVARAAKAMRSLLFDPLAEQAVKYKLLDAHVLRKTGGKVLGEGKPATPDQIGTMVERTIEAAEKFLGLETKKAPKRTANVADGDLSAATLDELFDDAGQSYITRIYNKQRIKSEYVRFKQILVDYLADAQQRAEALLARGADLGDDGEKLRQFVSLEGGDLEGQAAQIISHILGHPDGRMLFDLPPGVRGPLKMRTLRIRDELIEDFLIRDIGEIARYYTRTMAPDIEMTRMFGSLDMAEAFAKIADEADARVSALAEGGLTDAQIAKASKKILDNKEKAIRDLTAMSERLRGTYAIPEHPDAFFPRAGRIIKTANYLRLLGGMTLSALSDTFRPMMTQGIQSYFRDGIMPLFRELENVKLAAQEVKLAGTAWDMVLDTRTMAIADVLDDFGRYSKWERAIQMAQSNFGLVSLMAPWNAAMKQWAGLMVMSNIIRGAQRVAAGDAGESVVRRLAASNIDDANARVIAEQFAKHGREEGGVFLPNTQAWDVAQPNVRNALEAFRGAIARDVDRTIITPGQDKPLWLSTQVGSVVGQFKSFGMASVQRTILAGLQERDAGVLAGAVMMVGMGAVAEYLKATAAGRDLPKTEAQWLATAVDRSGLTAWLYDANHVAERFTGGAFGLARLTGRPISRYAARNWADSLLGPTAGLLKDMQAVSSTVFSDGPMRESDIRAMRRMVPYQNLFYMAWLFRQMEQSAGDALGAVPSGR